MSYPIITRKFTITSSTPLIVAIPDVAQYQIGNPDGATSLDVDSSLEQHVVATFDSTCGANLTFADTNPDTIVRDKGSWNDEHFVVGMAITVSGTASNNDTFTIDGVTDDTLTLIGGDTLVAEGPVASVTMDGEYVNATVWTNLEQFAVGIGGYTSLDPAPNGLKFTRTAGTGTVTVWVKS